MWETQIFGDKYQIQRASHSSSNGFIEGSYYFIMYASPIDACTNGSRNEVTIIKQWASITILSQWKNLFMKCRSIMSLWVYINKICVQSTVLRPPRLMDGTNLPKTAATMAGGKHGQYPATADTGSWTDWHHPASPILSTALPQHRAVYLETNITQPSVWTPYNTQHTQIVNWCPWSTINLTLESQKLLLYTSKNITLN